jgi:hypothetical protein
MERILAVPPTTMYAYAGYAGAADVYLALLEQGVSGDAVDLTKLWTDARVACKALERFAKIFPMAEPHYRPSTGRADWISGHQTRARKKWGRGLKAAERLGMPYEEALLHAEIARRTSGREQHKHAEAAKALFAGLGAPEPGTPPGVGGHFLGIG